MKTLGTLAFITLLLTACTTVNPLTAASIASVSGTFTVAVTATPATAPVGSNCRLEAPIQMDFTGALAGPAQGQISILALAPCVEVGTNPPGTYRDRFRAEVVFDGVIAEREGTARIIYQGTTRPGGAVRGLLRIYGVTGELAEVRGVLRVQAQAGVGGSYTGQLTGLP